MPQIDAARRLKRATFTLSSTRSLSFIDNKCFKQKLKKKTQCSSLGCTFQNAILYKTVIPLKKVLYSIAIYLKFMSYDVAQLLSLYYITFWCEATQCFYSFDILGSNKFVIYFVQNMFCWKSACSRLFHLLLLKEM